jgi:hypothetical protein
MDTGLLDARGLNVDLQFLIWRCSGNKHILSNLQSLFKTVRSLNVASQWRILLFELAALVPGACRPSSSLFSSYSPSYYSSSSCLVSLFLSQTRQPWWERKWGRKGATMYDDGYLHRDICVLVVTCMPEWRGWFFASQMGGDDVSPHFTGHCGLLLLLLQRLHNKQEQWQEWLIQSVLEIDGGALLPKLTTSGVQFTGCFVCVIGSAFVRLSLEFVHSDTRRFQSSLACICGIAFLSSDLQ